jgi:hypothetical protein
MKYKVFRNRINSMDTEYWADKNRIVQTFDSMKEAAKAALESDFILDDMAVFHIEPVEESKRGTTNSLGSMGG